MLHNSSKAGF